MKAKDKSEAITVKDNRNCLFCVKYRKCDDLKKSFKHICNKFTKYSSDALKEKKASTTIIVKDKKRSERLDYEQIIAEFNSQANLSPLPPDMKIDDRDIPQAKNFFEFTTSPKFLNIKPFAKQIEIGLKLHAEICMNPKCTDMDYYNNIPKKATPEQIQERIMITNWGCCPKCGYRKHEMLADGFRVPTELALLCGQRSGKSSLTTMLIGYETQGYLKLQNAPQAFDLLENTTLEIAMVALTATKAKELLYSKVEGYLREAPWFKEYHAMLDHYGSLYGEEMYRIRDMFASYRCRSLLLKASDPDMRKLRGADRCATATDELGWFISQEKGQAVKFNAAEIQKSLGNSLRTVRNAYYKLLKQGMDGIQAPMMYNISSPSSKKDLMVKAYERSRTNPRAIGFHLASWEFNPNLSKKDLKDEFDENYIAAMRDFGAVPPNSSAPYISDIMDVKGIIEKTRRNTVSLTPATVKVPGGKIMGTGKLRIIAPKDNNRRILAIDCGSSDNSFAIICGYFDEVVNRPIFDTFVEIPATSEAPLNFNSVFEDVIHPLIEHFNVNLIVADRFQSNKFIHDAQAQFDIAGEIYSVKYKDFEDCRQDLYDNKMTIPMPEMKPGEIETLGKDDWRNGFRKAPISHFLYQLITVQDMKKEVLKGQGLTDDLFRAFVLAYAYLVDPDPKYRELVSGTSRISTAKPVFVVGTLASRGKSGSLTSGRMGNSSNPAILASYCSRG